MTNLKGETIAVYISHNEDQVMLKMDLEYPEIKDYTIYELLYVVNNDTIEEES